MGTHTAATKSTSLTPPASHVVGALWLLLVPTAKVWDLHVPSCELGGVIVQNSLGNFKNHLILCPNTCGCYVASLDQKPGAQVSMPPSPGALTDAQFAQGIRNKDGKTVPQLAASASLPSLPAGGSIWKLLPLSDCRVFLTRTVMIRWQILPAILYSLRVWGMISAMALAR